MAAPTDSTDSPASTGDRPRNARGEGGKLRTEILEAMLRLIADEERMRPIPLSLREVAKEANITAPSIYRHFPDKESLSRAAVHSLFDQLLAAMDRADDEAAGDSAAQRFAAIAHGYCRFAQDNPGGFRLIFTVPPEFLGDEGPDTTEVAERWHAAVTRLAAEGMRLTQSPQEGALSLWSAVHGRLMLDMSVRDVWPQGGVHEFIEELTRSVTTID
ncbi:TetR/AcrR family transcriptional regulator [Saccharopolyspora gloriosae]|uniref:TetR/AcrR family transcriptional regulator n=1 Tax=Saccharopolyspora gloriosae TaxID=455344 RepID=UPI001FB7D4D9|nr:TetR/AcrR family transcriptional regulator [Saccharopolyspora gloriosae]